jgi:hypothetical protein
MGSPMDTTLRFSNHAVELFTLRQSLLIMEWSNPASPISADSNPNAFKPPGIRLLKKANIKEAMGFNSHDLPEGED